jgi:hypothetical protein
VTLTSIIFDLRHDQPNGGGIRDFVSGCRFRGIDTAAVLSVGDVSVANEDGTWFLS